MWSGFSMPSSRSKGGRSVSTKSRNTLTTSFISLDLYHSSESVSFEVSRKAFDVSMHYPHVDVEAIAVNTSLVALGWTGSRVLAAAFNSYAWGFLVDVWSCWYVDLCSFKVECGAYTRLTNGGVTTSNSSLSSIWFGAPSVACPPTSLILLAAPGV